MSNIYLDRYAYQQQQLEISEYGNPDLIVVVPCNNEPDLISSLDSLEACHPTNGSVSVIVVINASQSSSSSVQRNNENTLKQCNAWVKEGKGLTYHFILENELPKKHAGVGLARKIGMDEAVRIFEHNDKDGAILCFDADSVCEPNLLVEVERRFEEDPSITGCSIHFEHPLSGELPANVYDGIINYELHLRYYVDGLRYTGFPYAYHTIGSSMAVRSSVYQKQGGMNRRKAGEDFYFLHKIIPLGNFHNVNNTKIIPSPRRSDRVPFGTGRAIGTWLDENKEVMFTYHPHTFEDLKVFFAQVDQLYRIEREDLLNVWGKLPETFQSYISIHAWEKKINEFNSQSTNLLVFRKRFYQWFDGFQVLKFVHYSRDHFYPEVPIKEAVDWFFDQVGVDSKPWSIKEQLLKLRALDRARENL